jgi:hypothetical protein
LDKRNISFLHLHLHKYVAEIQTSSIDD